MACQWFYIHADIAQDIDVFIHQIELSEYVVIL